jgi:hypothetical protein
MWFNPGITTNLFDIIATGINSNANVSVIVDLVVEFTLSNQTYSPNLVSSLSSTLSVGSTYYPPLDGNTGVFFRQGLPNVNT